MGRTTTTNTQNNSFYPSDPEMEEIKNLDFNTQPEISGKLQTTIDATMSGFNAGFRENQNLDSEVNYLLSRSDMDMHFLKSEVQLRIPNYDTTTVKSQSIKGTIGPNFIGYTVVSLEFVGSNYVEPRVENPSTSYFNYFLGSDSDNWITNAPSYAKLRYNNLYDNIDLIYTIKNGELKYDFYVYPGGNYKDIRLQWNGPVALQQSTEGLQITISTLIGEKSFTDSNPINFLGAPDEYHQSIFGTFQLLNENTYGFSIEDYDHSEVLIIDPVLEFSTLIGGSSNDDGLSMAVDSNGDVYITGRTVNYLTPFPTNSGTYNETHNSAQWGSDVFVTKLAANGSTLIYSTFIGGLGSDWGFSIAVDNNGDVYITGDTQDDTKDYPTTAGAYDETHNGLKDVFVTKLAANGSTLIYSTFIGGSGNDYGHSLAIDNNGNVYVSGYTVDDTVDFPTTAGAYNETHNGASDVFVTKLTADGSSLTYSTFVGGSGNDNGESITVDNNGFVYITGGTADDTKDYPTTAGAFDETHNGGIDVYLTKLSTNGSSLIYSTFLGGTSTDYGYSLAVDGKGDIYVTGYTGYSPTGFPTTVGAYNEIHNGGIDAFVTKLAANGATLIYSTFVGGSGLDYGHSLAIESNGDVYITGRTENHTTNFPTTSTAYDEIHNGLTDVFVTKLAANGSILLYSTFLGGKVSDEGWSLAIDDNGDVYIAGTTAEGTPNFPVTTGAYDATHNGITDVFVTKLTGLKLHPPFNVKSIATSNKDGGYIFLVWDSLSIAASDIESYKIYRGTTSGSYSYLGSSPGYQAFYNDTSAVENQTYFYAITSSSSLGESILSLEHSTILQSISVSTVTEIITQRETGPVETVTQTETEQVTVTADPVTSTSTKTDDSPIPILITPIILAIVVLGVTNLRKRKVKTK